MIMDHKQKMKALMKEFKQTTVWTLMMKGLKNQKKLWLMLKLNMKLFCELTSIGIQPEVSSIYIGADLSDHSDEESGLESDDDDDESEYFSSDDEIEIKSPTKYKETTLPFEVEDPGMMAFGLQSPPIEITPFSDDEAAASDARSSPVPTSSKPTTLRPAKVSKSASMDSTDTVIHIKPDELKDPKDVLKEDQKEEDAEDVNKQEKRRRRKKKKKLKTKTARENELRFLKNSGNQTSPILLDCSTQYEIFTVDSGSQYEIKGRSRKCQTKLSSINHEQLQGIRETVQKLKRRESEMSRVSNVSISESDWDSEAGKESDVAEISLDLSVVALGVDETGKVVEVPKAVSVSSQAQRESISPASEQTDVQTKGSESLSTEKVHLDSEDEEIESLEELELYTTDAGIQTESKIMLDKQDHATPKTMDIIKNCSTQTTFSTFHLPQKVYESASTSSDEEEDKSDKDQDKKSEQEVFFMTNTGVQTMHTSFHLEEKPKIVEEELQKEENVIETETEIEEMPLFLKNSDCQTELNIEMVTCSTSTEDVRFVGDTETSEESSQTNTEVQDLEVQTTRQECELQLTTMQTEWNPVTEESQTDPPKGSEIHSQTDPPDTRSFICQTELQSGTEVEIQVGHLVESTPVECQTEVVHHEEFEVQTEIDVSATETQTESTAEDAEMQTDMAESEAAESQTELDVNHTEMQTDEKEVSASECQTEQLNVELQQTQTEEVTFVRDVDVADQITQVDSTEVKDSETQYSLSIEDRDVQATPISFETQTQHSIEIDVKSCQTEGVKMKNKKSQVEDDDSKLSILKIDNESQIEVDRSSINLSPIRLDVSHSFTMTEPGASEEKEVQVDEDCFEKEETSQRFMTGPLWSDFDYTPELGEEGEEDEEVMDGETQTQDGSEPYEEEKEGEEEMEEGDDAVEKQEGDTSEDTNLDEKGVKGIRKTKKRIVKSSRASSDDLLGPSSAQRSSGSLADEFAVQCAPESSDIKIQTVKFVRKKKKEEKGLEPKVEMSTSTVQATTEMCEQSAGDVEDDWLQVYVQELDEERRMRMSDIGIQTGVLARVQHIYTRPISDDAGAGSSATAPITLRKSSDSSDHISTRTAKSSEESLAPTALSAAESMDDRLWPERPSPFASRHSSLKRRKKEKDVEKKGDKTNIVQDLRARFEMKSPAPKSPPKEEGEGSSSDPKQFF
ncbi:hypothetical protein CAEBREN_29415 [Caenorhabditis brenneri]|uniref:Uncharacterized protein n=1 Tax=Caenorhabditis brenneri TaxID=135651 RepID=G0NXA6_CAEBE|nr:hypothetical protein CAEBREN_29415 [Caenorhabditis brenneri]